MASQEEQSQVTKDHNVITMCWMIVDKEQDTRGDRSLEEVPAEINYSFSKHDQVKEEENRRALERKGQKVLSPDGGTMSFGQQHTVKFREPVVAGPNTIKRSD